ncbi:MAG: SPOR domain-containing protein [Bacteroidia bacterium]
MNLENQISELLYHHDCVIVADMGGFVANYRPAFMHPAHHTISPPSKKIAFNASLTNNDGLLANHVAAKLNINYTEACNMIREFREDCFAALNKGEQLSLDKIGVLYLDREKNIQFNADNSSNYLLDSFGLGTVHAPVLKREYDKNTIVKAFENKEKKSWWRLLEVIPAAAAIVLLLLNPGSIERKLNSSLNSFNPLDTFTKPAPSKIISNPINKITPVESLLVKDTLNISIDAPAPTVTDNTVNVNEITTDNNPNSNTVSTEKIPSALPDANENSVSKFYIIAGCFKIEANAENFKSDLIEKGFKADIIGTYKGLQVVSCSVASSRSEAQAELQNIKHTLEAGAWIMKK